MNDLDLLTLLVYTNDKRQYLHKPCLERITTYFPEALLVYIANNSPLQYQNTVVYNDNLSHSNQMIQILKQLPTKYVLYMQEDYILYQRVKVDNISRYLKIMEEDSKVGFIRLIHSGLGNSQELYKDEFLLINNDSQYYYSTQATIWRKAILINMFKLSNVDSIFQESKNSKFLKKLNIVGLCPQIKGVKVGNHFNSYDFPYLATAVVKGKWNIRQYALQIEQLKSEYNL